MFESIVGQESANKTLDSMIKSNRMPHALLFVGPYGVGKGEMALEVARVLLCENGLNSMCKTCRSCIRTSKIGHPDLHILFPYKAPPPKVKDYTSWLDGLIEYKKLIWKEAYSPVVFEKGRQIVTGLVSEVQNMLLESSFEGGRKVCIILSADRLNNKTANSLLKIFEEPPEGVHFILTTEQLSSVLPTIVSRASIVRFRRLKIEEIESYLEKNGVDDPIKRFSYASLGDGSIKNAKAYAFDDKADIRSRAFEMYKSIAFGEPDDVVSGGFPFVYSRDFLEAEEYINGFVLFTKSVLECKLGKFNENEEYSDTIKTLSRSTDLPLLHRLSARLEEGLEMLSRNVSISMVLTSIS